MKRNSQRRQPKADELFDVFIDLHVLHAAAKEPVTAERLVQVLTRRGYEVSSRSISVVLRRFERRGWLRVQAVKGGPRGCSSLLGAVRTLWNDQSLSLRLYMERYPPNHSTNPVPRE